MARGGESLRRRAATAVMAGSGAAATAGAEPTTRLAIAPLKIFTVPMFILKKKKDETFSVDTA